MFLNFIKIIFLCFVPSLLVVFALMKYANLRNKYLCLAIEGFVLFGLIILLIKW